MKISAGKVAAFIARPDPMARAILVYGPDAGAVRERCWKLAGDAVGGETDDPFRFVELPATSLINDPPRLTDEAASLSLSGGSRAILVRGAGDGLADIFKSFLTDPGHEALVVIEAGDLPPRSRLRKLFEAAENAAALPSYLDQGGDLTGFIRNTLKELGVTASPEALSFLSRNLGVDRQLTRKELEKLALYAGNGGEVDLGAARACISDSSALSFEDISYAVGEGNLPQLEQALERVFLEGMAPTALLRGAAGHFLRLYRVGSAMASGATVDLALRELKPPLFFKLKDRFLRQLGTWSPSRARIAMDRLLEAEIDCKTTGFPAETICHRILLSLAYSAKSR